jgi:hypothetical protein
MVRGKEVQMKTIKCFMLLAAFLAIPTLNSLAYGQSVWDVWEKKPYQQWSFIDAGIILYDSPWAKKAKDFYSPYPIQIYLHSALPIRQALVRRRQIRLKYDVFTEADKAKFDTQVKDFLECAGCKKFYILTYRILSKELSVRRTLNNYSLDDLKPYIFLVNDKGERRNLAHFIPPDTTKEDALLYASAVFFFERFDEQGKPLLTTDNKKFYLQIDEKTPQLRSISVKKISFEVHKLVHNGEIIF